MALAFDSLKYAKTLEKAGVKPEVAEAHATAQVDALRVVIKDNNLATKADIERIHKELKVDIEMLRKETTVNIEALRKDLKIQILLAIGSISVFLTAVIGIATAVILHVIK